MLNPERQAIDAAPVLADGLQAYIDLFRASQQGAAGTLSSLRLHSDLSAGALACPLPAGVRIVNTFIVRPGREIGVRIYLPASPQQRPALCYFHGGGFTLGTIESFDSVASGLAEHTGAVVASVQYRRLPENAYRDAQEDCYAALVWLHDHADQLGINRSRIAVAGDSVGALLATVTAMMARDRGGPWVVCQLLLYGAFALQPGRPCYAASQDPLLSGDRVEAFIAAYRRSLAGDEATPPVTDDHFALPPAIMVAAEHDPLREEGWEYAQRLREAGVPVEFSVARGMIHGFLRARRLSPPAEQEMVRISRALRPHLWADHAAMVSALLQGNG